MKRIVSALLALAVLAALVAVTTTSKHAVPAVYAESGCGVANLHGPYAFSQEGYAPLVEGGNFLPFFNVGVLASDGAGAFSVSFTDVQQGVASTETDTGTYTVNSDCTGSISITTGPGAGATFNIVIIGGGAEIFAINTAAGFTSRIDAKKMRSE